MCRDRLRPQEAFYACPVLKGQGTQPVNGYVPASGGGRQRRGVTDVARQSLLINVSYSCRFLLPHREMLPNIQPLLVDAHGSDVAQSFFIYLTLFSRSIHELVGHHSTPLLDSALQGTKLTPAVAIRVASYQSVHQLPSTHIGLLLQPLQYQTPYTLERVRPCPPCVRHP